ncbi:hypothetical protein [Mycobacterium helveticum]|uniref:Uncharacterized protein n=1 Tax=Mycobacterium helveticum TaxID=2592811 RepID=A0A557XMH5_9MYCO|nr:hypothetical protein [Mycobacterium helveticum]TVS84355.1 hypothetical protein FPZ46_17890 [Mycobacterium helveticum]TVS87031.1 hypothetical protein FPZ47_16775 [Mycobacterium helveticum]
MPSVKWLEKPEAHDVPAADPAKIKKGRPLSPILLVRGDPATSVALQIADGYHRGCAGYHTDETPTFRLSSLAGPMLEWTS